MAENGYPDKIIEFNSENTSGEIKEITPGVKKKKLLSEMSFDEIQNQNDHHPYINSPHKFGVLSALRMRCQQSNDAYCNSDIPKDNSNVTEGFAPQLTPCQSGNNVKPQPHHPP